jgi:hypothetical protein
MLNSKTYLKKTKNEYLIRDDRITISCLQLQHLFTVNLLEQKLCNDNHLVTISVAKDQLKHLTNIEAIPYLSLVWIYWAPRIFKVCLRR